jgi:hypothetical protein
MKCKYNINENIIAEDVNKIAVNIFSYYIEITRFTAIILLKMLIIHISNIFSVRQYQYHLASPPKLPPVLKDFTPNLSLAVRKFCKDNPTEAASL